MVIGVFVTVRSVVLVLPATPNPPPEVIAPLVVPVEAVVAVAETVPEDTTVVVKVPVLGTNVKFDLANGDKVVGNEPDAVPNNG
jgi:hypothetical protein